MDEELRAAETEAFSRVSSPNYDSRSWHFAGFAAGVAHAGVTPGPAPLQWAEGRPTKEGLYVVMMGPEYPGYIDSAAYYEGCHWPSYARKHYGPIPEPDVTA